MMFLLYTYAVQAGIIRLCVDFFLLLAGYKSDIQLLREKTSTNGHSLHAKGWYDDSLTLFHLL